MQLGLLIGETRLLIGSPSVNQVPEREILSFLVPSIQWLAGYLKMAVKTDESIGLVAGQREYPMPLDLLYFIWVEVNGKMLDPTTTWALNSGSGTVGGSTTSLGISNSGLTWRTVPASTPTSYAVENRQLILYPPASADFVANNAQVMAWRYVSLGAYLTNEGGVGLTPQGFPSLTDADLQVVRWDAAKAWIAAHMLGQPPDAVQAMQATIAAYQAEIAARLPECKRRWEDSMLGSHRTLRVEVGGRFGSAR